MCNRLQAPPAPDLAHHVKFWAEGKRTLTAFDGLLFSVVMNTRCLTGFLVAATLILAALVVLPRAVDAHHRGHFHHGPIWHHGPFFGPPPGVVFHFPAYLRYYAPPPVIVPAPAWPPPTVVVPAPPVPSTHVYVYPSKGQSPEQLAKDRYECHRWAVSQSGFDPSASAPAPPPVASSTYVVPPARVPPDPISGAAGGAALGALGGAIAGDAGTGAAIGAAVGAVAGIANESERLAAEDAARAQNQAIADSIANAQRQHASRAREYKRALIACLTGRGYSVR